MIQHWKITYQNQQKMTYLRPLLITIFISYAFLLSGQNTPVSLSYPDTLWSDNDTFYVSATYWDSPWKFTTTQSDTVDLGTDGFEGAEFMIWTSADTLTIPYVNAPEDQKLYIPISSKNGTTIYRMRFNEQHALYSEEYIRNHQNSIGFLLPETYELANIILSLSDCSELTGNRVTATAYAKRVESHFAPFKSHALIQILNQKCADNRHWSVYYGFRENSNCF